jgi:oxygen-dependent protoporphyrinogen oxidase
MRRLGKEALERIAEPLVAGIHAGEPESMSIKSSFPRFVDMEKKYRSLILGMLKMRRMLKGTGRDVSLFMTFKSGLYELIEKLVEVIDPGSIRTNALVRGIKKQGNLFTLHLNDGSIFQCDAIVLALPSYVSGSILKDINPGLSKILGSIPFVSTATISLAYEKKNFSHPLNGYGFVIPRTEKRKIMAVTWTSSKFPYRVPDGFVMLRTFVGGVYNRNMVSMSDEELLKIVTDELRSIMGISTRPYLYRIFRWHNSMPQYTVGHEEKIKKIDEELEKLPGLFLTGSSYKGIGISECIKNAGEVAERIGRFIGL